MYAALPPAWRWRMKATLSLAWGLISGGGIAAICAAPNSVVREWGPIPLGIGALVLVIAGVLAILGLVLNRYRWEWLAAWLAGIIFSPYVVTIWYLEFTSPANRLTAAFFNTALLVCILSRSFSCAAHAAKLREMHQAETHAIEVVSDGSE